MKKLFILLALIVSSYSYGQIALPEGFTCSKKAGAKADKFTSGKFNFVCRDYHTSGLRENELVRYLMNTTGIHPHLTTDGVFISTGRSNGKYRYTLVIPDWMVKIEINSETQDPQFTPHAKWLLHEVKKVIDNRGDLYLTDHSGKKCS